MTTATIHVVSRGDVVDDDDDNFVVDISKLRSIENQNQHHDR